MRDFTLTIYRELVCALKRSGYAFYTFEEWCDGKASGRYVILRHDVDLKAGHSLATARIEAEEGVRASYYFRIVPESNQPDMIRAIASLGHEIGYHYEDLSLFNGNREMAYAHFQEQLAYFRQFYPVRTICMHGSPASKWDNRSIWESYDYRNDGICGEPYFDFFSAVRQVTYLTDTARMWDGGRYNVRDKSEHASTVAVHSTHDLIAWLDDNPREEVLMITTHPQRWTDKKSEWMKEYVFQHLKNVVKAVVIKMGKKEPRTKSQDRRQN